MFLFPSGKFSRKHKVTLVPFSYYHHFFKYYKDRPFADWSMPWRMSWMSSPSKSLTPCGSSPCPKCFSRSLTMVRPLLKWSLVYVLPNRIESLRLNISSDTYGHALALQVEMHYELAMEYLASMDLVIPCLKLHQARHEHLLAKACRSKRLCCVCKCAYLIYTHIFMNSIHISEYVCMKVQGSNWWSNLWFGYSESLCMLLQKSLSQQCVVATHRKCSSPWQSAFVFWDRMQRLERSRTLLGTLLLMVGYLYDAYH